MTKTKEIDVWVALDSKNERPFLMWGTKPSEDCATKAKLIITLPERKIELTESQFDEAWNEAVGTIWDKDKDDLRKKLFGGAE